MDISFIWVIAGAIIVAGGWIAYGIWRYKIYQEEKKEPGRKTEHLEKVKKSFEDYTKKMEEYKLKPYERKKEDKKGGV
jgi:uncharacterized membrane-anchored protein YhcB (DUF1043 family)